MSNGCTVVKLNNGQKMPAIGLGTFRGISTEFAVNESIGVGYRLLDTAFAYGNEKQIGQVLKGKLKDGSIKREDIFVVSKIWSTLHKPEDVIPTCKLSLADLQLDYLDLYLIHWPMSFKRNEDIYDVFTNITEDPNHSSLEGRWLAMEEVVKQGYAKNIGLSNFNSEQIERILKVATIKPVVLQVEVNPYINQKKLIAFCKERDIMVMGHSPFRCPIRYGRDLIEDPVLKELAQKYNKSVGQIILRYLTQIGVVPIPKTDKLLRLKENIDIFDVTLSDEDMVKIDLLNRNSRCSAFDITKSFKEYPYNIEY